MIHLDQMTDNLLIIYLTVRSVSGGIELFGRVVMLLEWQVLHQCNAVDVVEDSHEQLKCFDKREKLPLSFDFFILRTLAHQLDDSPDGDDQAAQGKFRSANWHLVVASFSLATR
jgi:hypothetical protein